MLTLKAGSERGLEEIIREERFNKRKHFDCAVSRKLKFQGLSEKVKIS